MDFGDLKMGHRGTRLHIIYQKKKNSCLCNEIFWSVQTNKTDTECQICLKCSEGELSPSPTAKGHSAIYIPLIPGSYFQLVWKNKTPKLKRFLKYNPDWYSQVSWTSLTTLHKLHTCLLEDKSKPTILRQISCPVIMLSLLC